MGAKKTWQEKLLDSKGLPKVVLLKEKAQRVWKGRTMAVPSPMEVREIMDAVPKGKLITIEEIREMVARKHNADIGCPLTCGIFSWIVAHAAVEETPKNMEEITPFWRTLKTGGELNPKYPGGIEEQKKHLESEGHQVVQKGKKYIVNHYENYLMRA
jgi:alkylated DNA nucleotide flippase Atl1